VQRGIGAERKSELDDPVVRDPDRRAFGAVGVGGVLPIELCLEFQNRRIFAGGGEAAGPKLQLIDHQIQSAVVAVSLAVARIEPHAKRGLADGIGLFNVGAVGDLAPNAKSAVRRQREAEAGRGNHNILQDQIDVGGLDAAGRILEPLHKIGKRRLAEVEQDRSDAEHSWRPWQQRDEIVSSPFVQIPAPRAGDEQHVVQSRHRQVGEPRRVDA
jgi:hypothetical protein